MIELSLISLLNSMSPKFCEYKSQNMDTTTAVLLSFSEMHNKYEADDIQKVIRNSFAVKETAVLIALANCPIDAVK